MIDLHAHILPGLDDGASDWDETMAMAGTASAHGAAGLFATPHFIEGEVENRRETVLEKVAELRRRLAAAGIPLAVYPGLEVYLTPNLPALLNEGRLLTLNDQGRHLLVELPMGEWPIYTEQILFQLTLAGITPILAHPERNRSIVENPDHLAAMVPQGVLVQINAGSLTGMFGQRVKKCAEKLAAGGLVHFLGSDAHSNGRRSPSLREAAERLRRLTGRDAARQILHGNAQRLLNGQIVETPARRSRSFFKMIVPI